MERTTVGAYLRTTQAWCLQLCEKETLDHGIAYVNARHASLPEACHLREVVIENPADAPAAFERTEAWFGQRGMRCLRWAPAEMQAAASLKSLLEPKGFAARLYTVLALTRWDAPAAESDIRVLPARAMRSAFLSTFDRPEESRAWAERLDDPHLDMFVALGPGGAVGRGGIHQVGDLTRVVEPVVRQESAERALIATVLGLARRLANKTVLMHTESANHAALARYSSYGFSPAGEFVEFDRVD